MTAITRNTSGTTVYSTIEPITSDHETTRLHITTAGTSTLVTTEPVTNTTRNNSVISTTYSIPTSGEPGLTTLQPVSTSTSCTSPWKGISFGLIGVLAVLLVVCIVLAILLYRQRKRLKWANVTLYAREPDHQYTALTQKGKKGPPVELTNIASIDVEEEVDSPTFSAPPPPPTFPRSTSQTTFDKPPELPTRRPKQILTKSQGKDKKLEKTKILTDKERLVKSIDKDTPDGIENAAFSNTEETVTAIIPDHEVHIEVSENNNDDDDDTYEKYNHDLYRKIKKMDKPVKEPEVIENAMAYEDPVESTNQQKRGESEEFIKKQSSSSGLPEVFLSVSDTCQGKPMPNESPLQPNQDDIYDNDEVEMKDTGLPSVSDIQCLDDLQMYEDVDIDGTKADQLQIVSSPEAVAETVAVSMPTGQALDSLEANVDDSDNAFATSLYDSGEIGAPSDSGEESGPDLYEDYEGGSAMPTVRNDFKKDNLEHETPTEPSNSIQVVEPNTTYECKDQSQEQIHFDSEISIEHTTQDLVLSTKTNNDVEKTILNHEMHTKPELDINVDGVDKQTNTTENIDNIENSHNVENSNELLSRDTESQIPDILPRVPPRRDLMSKLSISSDSSDNPTLEFRAENAPNVSTSPVLAAVRNLETKPGKQVGDINNSLPPQESYFLDMEDRPEELSERQQKRISVHKMVDSEMPLEKLLQLYDEPNGIVGNNSSGSIGEQRINTGLSTAQMAEFENKHSGPNGVIANGRSLQNIDESYTDDDDVYDVPPPIQSQR